LVSFDVTIFESSFERICEVLAEFGINYAWAEKDRRAAMQAWQQFNELTTEQRKEIARRLISDIELQLTNAIRKALDESIPQRVRRVTVAVITERRETFSFLFDTIRKAAEFLQRFGESLDLDTTHAPTLLTSQNLPEVWGKAVGLCYKFLAVMCGEVLGRFSEFGFDRRDCDGWVAGDESAVRVFGQPAER
jgi:hypothetical protein